MMTMEVVSLVILNVYLVKMVLTVFNVNLLILENTIVNLKLVTVKQDSKK